MNKLPLTLLLLVVTLGSYGQSKNVTYRPSHDLRISAGVLTPYGTSTYLYQDTPYYNSPLNDYKEAQYYYQGAHTVFGALSVEYKYNIKKWLSLGASVTYERFESKRFDRITAMVNKRTTIDAITVLPMVKFQYLTSPLVTLYSQIGLGVGLNTSTIKEDAHRTLQYTELSFAAQFTAIGVTVGKSLFGFAEIGYGSQGVFKMGIGYKFN